METKHTTWQQRFDLTTCPASKITTKIPATAQGVAVFYSQNDSGEKIILVLESRNSGLRSQCEKRLQSGKLPPAEELIVSFKAEPPADTSPEGINAACREQVIFAGLLRKELRPAMR